MGSDARGSRPTLEIDLKTTNFPLSCRLSPVSLITCGSTAAVRASLACGGFSILAQLLAHVRHRPGVQPGAIVVLRSPVQRICRFPVLAMFRP